MDNLGVPTTQVPTTASIANGAPPNQPESRNAPPSAYEARWSELRASMTTSGLDALVVCGSAAVGQYGYLAFATGFVPATKTACALFRPHAGPLVFLPSAADRVALAGSAIPDSDVRITGEADAITHSPVFSAVADEILASGAQRVGVVGLAQFVTLADHQRLRARAPHTEFVDATPLMAHIKARKNAPEIALAREAVELMGPGLATAASLLHDGVELQSVSAGIEMTLRSMGAWRTMVFVNSGPHYARIATTSVAPRSRLITVLVEGASRFGYWGELGDLFSIGEPSAADAAVAAACYEALSNIRERIGPGTPTSEPLRILKETGKSYGLRLGRGIGHGVGMDHHDLPSLDRAEPGDVFEVGHIVSIHPHFYRETPDVGGAIADTLVVTPAGARSLTKRKHSLRILETDR